MQTPCRFRNTDITFPPNKLCDSREAKKLFMGHWKQIAILCDYNKVWLNQSSFANTLFGANCVCSFQTSWMNLPIYSISWSSNLDKSSICRYTWVYLKIVDSLKPLYKEEAFRNFFYSWHFETSVKSWHFWTFGKNRKFCVHIPPNSVIVQRREHRRSEKFCRQQQHRYSYFESIIKSNQTIDQSIFYKRTGTIDLGISSWGIEKMAKVTAVEACTQRWRL